MLVFILLGQDVDGEEKSLGVYSTHERAHIARCNLEEKHGEHIFQSYRIQEFDLDKDAKIMWEV